MRIRYCNYRGEISDRTVIPIELWCGRTEHHTDKQWFLEAVDVERGVTRSFVLDMIMSMSAPIQVSMRDFTRDSLDGEKREERCVCTGRNGMAVRCTRIATVGDICEGCRDHR